MSLPRLLVLDLDGTTLDARRQLSPRDVAAAHALAEAGVQVTIATGRLFTGTRWVAEALGVQGSVAVMNGSELVDVATGETRLGRYLDADASRTLRTLAFDLGLDPVLFTSHQIHHDARTAHHAPFLTTWTEDLAPHDDVHFAPGWHAPESLLAVGLLGPEDEIRRLVARVADLLPPELEAVSFPSPGGGWFFKVRHGAEDKGTALVRLAAERGTTAAETVAVGDWINDVPMLRTAGRSFAMAHAIAEVRAAADEGLDASHDGGAVAEVAARVWGIAV